MISKASEIGFKGLAAYLILTLIVFLMSEIFDVVFLREAFSSLYSPIGSILTRIGDILNNSVQFYGAAPTWSFVSTLITASALIVSNAANRRHTEKLAARTAELTKESLDLQRDLAAEARDDTLRAASQEIERSYQKTVDRLEAELAFRKKDDERLVSEKDRADREFLLDVYEQFLIEFSWYASIEYKSPFWKRGKTEHRTNQAYQNAQKRLSGPVKRDDPRSNMSVLYAFYVLQIIAATSLVSKARWQRPVTEAQKTFLRKLTGQVTRMIKWSGMPGKPLLKSEHYAVAENRMLIRDPATDGIRLLNWVEFADQYLEGNAIFRIADEIAFSFRDTFSHPDEWMADDDTGVRQFKPLRHQYELDRSSKLVVPVQKATESSLSGEDDSLSDEDYIIDVSEPELDAGTIDDEPDEGDTELPNSLFFAHDRQNQTGDRLLCLCLLLQRAIEFERRLFSDDSVGKSPVGFHNTNSILHRAIFRQLKNRGKEVGEETSLGWHFIDAGDNSESLAEAIGNLKNWQKARN